MAKGAENEEQAEGGEKKSKLGLIIALVVGLVVVVGGVVVGIVLGPKLMGGAQPAEASATVTAAPTSAAEAEPEKVVSVSFEPIIIDLRGRRGEVHHLKVGLAAELAEGVTEEEFKLVRPRGREAALTYLRTLTFKEVTDPKKYGKIKKELAKKVVKSVGKDRVHRVLLVDFVAQ